MNNDYKIDIVLPWVDGTNPEWLARFKKYNQQENGDSRDIRFRDWGLLRYWFRSIEKFIPWVNKIHFITSGELPEWIELNNPKLCWIRHEEFIPQEYLPTFSVRTIELNLHRIPSLSEHFIYFNDDFFITKPLKITRFFNKELPCDYAVMTARPANGGTIHCVINDLVILDKHFQKHSVIKKNLYKWFSVRYGKGLINNILLYPWKEFSGFIDPHIPYAFRKTTFEKVWNTDPVILDKTCKNKFRTHEDVNQWLVRYWQLAEGNFYPKDIKKNTLCIDINDETYLEICEVISKQKQEIICINDSTEITDFEKFKKAIQQSFETILPDKSSFEKF